MEEQQGAAVRATDEIAGRHVSNAEEISAVILDSDNYPLTFEFYSPLNLPPDLFWEPLSEEIKPGLAT